MDADRTGRCIKRVKRNLELEHQIALARGMLREHADALQELAKV
jgi:hypothetical protein